MIDEFPAPVRPVPRWVRGWAVVTIVATLVLLTLGGFVTSYRVGMSDPVWPTEPWYLAANDHVWVNEPQPGFLIEHTHRLAGFTVGVCAIVLAIGAVASDRKRRWAGLALLFVLVAVYGKLHGDMALAQKAKLAGETIPWPWASAAATGVAAFLAVAYWVPALRTFGGGCRFFSVLGLVCVMAQGLLGGFRVFLNDWFGTNLAAVHGVFAQLTFAILAAVAVLGAPRRDGDSLPGAAASRFTRLGWTLAAVLVVQLIWAVMVRHNHSPLGQRLHILTAFVATGLIVWIAAAVATTPAAKPRYHGASIHLVGMLAVQLALGVEAYMAKFASTGPQATLLPEQRVARLPDATLRTLHQLVGTGLLASAVMFAVRTGRRPVELDVEEHSSSAEPMAAVS